MEPVLPGVQAQLLPGMLRSLPKPAARLARGGVRRLPFIRTPCTEQSKHLP